MHIHIRERAALRFFAVDTSSMEGSEDFFDALGIDSLKALELLSELEIEFDVEIPDYELQGITTFAGLGAKIDERR